MSTSECRVILCRHGIYSIEDYHRWRTYLSTDRSRGERFVQDWLTVRKCFDRDRKLPFCSTEMEPPPPHLKVSERGPKWQPVPPVPPFSGPSSSHKGSEDSVDKARDKLAESLKGYDGAAKTKSEATAEDRASLLFLAAKRAETLYEALASVGRPWQPSTNYTRTGQTDMKNIPEFGRGNVHMQFMYIVLFGLTMDASVRDDFLLTEFRKGEKLLARQRQYAKNAAERKQQRRRGKNQE